MAAVLQKPRNAGIGSSSKLRDLQTIFSFIHIISHITDNFLVFVDFHIVFAELTILYQIPIHLKGII